MENLKKSPPWETFFNELKSLFDGDPDVKVVKKYEEDEKIIELLVTGEAKASALMEILPGAVSFGVVGVDIVVKPSNDGSTKRHLLMNAFNGNANVEFIDSATLPGGGEVNYVVMSDQIVQFFDDNLASCYGAKTMLLEDVARDVFREIDGVYFCTEKLQG